MSANRVVSAQREPRRRRPRSASESLLSIALGLEAALVFFVALAVFRFDRLPPGVAFGGGVAVILILIVTARMLRYRVGLWLGWVLQVALIATGFLLPLMFFIGAGFAAIWVFCFVTGARLDRRTLTSTSDPSGLPNHTEPPTRSTHD
ncbi:MAG: DUF4233 domain-containing protein [Lacisediminihabitans sp.]